MIWTHVILTIPVEHVEAANRLAAIFDPDTGGAETFGRCRLSPTGQEPATHYMAGTAIKPEYLPLLTHPEQTMVALTGLAAERERTPPAQADVEAWCASVVVGHPEGLQVISDDAGVE